MGCMPTSRGLLLLHLTVVAVTVWCAKLVVPASGRGLLQGISTPAAPIADSSATAAEAPATDDTDAPASASPGHANSLFYTPEQVSRRAELAKQAAAQLQLSPQLTDALVEAAKSSEVNDVDAEVATHSTARSIAPWARTDLILLPKAAEGTVPAWPPGAAEAGQQLTTAQAAQAQPIPPSAGGTNCCNQLQQLGFQTNLPVVVVTTNSQVVPIRKDITATVCTCGAVNDSDIETAAQIKVRGSSSAVQMVKKSFGITLYRPKNGTNRNHTNHSLGGKADLPFLGMAAASEWALFGDDGDLTVGMRNAMAYDLSRAMGQWAPHTIYTELFLVQDGLPLSAHHYWGAYLAMEKIELQQNRVHVKKLNVKHSSDLSGGYLWGYERSLWPDDVRLVPSNWSLATLAACPSGDGRDMTYLLHEPKAKGVVKEQQGLVGTSNDTRLVAWSARFLGSVEAALVNDSLPTTGEPIPSGSGAWRALVDEGAFIDYLLAQETTKDAAGPLVMGPVWDFNEAFGMCCGYPIEGYQQQGQSNGSSGGSAISAEGWRFNICDEPARCVADPTDGISLWWRAVWHREPDFRVRVARRWRTLRSGPLSDAALTARLEFYQRQLAFAAPRNFLRWKAVVQSPYFPTEQQLYTYNVQQMESWLMARVAWLDSELQQVEAAALPQLSPSTQQLSGNGTVGVVLTESQRAAVMAAVVKCADEEAQAVEVGKAGAASAGKQQADIAHAIQALRSGMATMVGADRVGLTPVTGPSQQAVVTAQSQGPSGL